MQLKIKIKRVNGLWTQLSSRMWSPWFSPPLKNNNLTTLLIENEWTPLLDLEFLWWSTALKGWCQDVKGWREELQLKSHWRWFSGRDDVHDRHVWREPSMWTASGIAVFPFYESIFPWQVVVWKKNHLRHFLMMPICVSLFLNSWRRWRKHRQARNRDRG